jgi:hypothetical protein
MSKEFWERAARIDPLWAILSDPTKRGRRWELPAFFQTGRREISLLMFQLKQLKRMPRAGRALDFGCGVGRLTQALGTHFPECIGVDVSPTMIKLATQLNHTPGVRYVLNESPTLEQFPSGHFDFVYSDIVLQHLEPNLAQRFIPEFIRVLAPGGVTVFQLPSHRRDPAEAPRPSQNMAPEAYRARLQAVGSLPATMSAGQSATIVVDVHNISPTAWDQWTVGPIRLGNHWRAADGEMLIQDDGRSTLPTEMTPGTTVRALLEVVAPSRGGSMICELDLVHEGLSWFGDRGSSTLSMPTQVIDAAEETRDVPAIATVPDELTFPDIYDALGTSDGDVGSFPMNGVPREIIVADIRHQGAELFFVEEDARGGPEWHGFRYFVSKPAM